jgi:hypothetical protein
MPLNVPQLVIAGHLDFTQQDGATLPVDSAAFPVRRTGTLDLGFALGGLALRHDRHHPAGRLRGGLVPP